MLKRKDSDTYSDNREDKRPRSAAAATKADHHHTPRGRYPDEIINDIIQFLPLESQFDVLDKVKPLKDILRRPTTYIVFKSQSTPLSTTFTKYHLSNDVTYIDIPAGQEVSSAAGSGDLSLKLVHICRRLKDRHVIYPKMCIIIQIALDTKSHCVYKPASLYPHIFQYFKGLPHEVQILKEDCDITKLTKSKDRKVGVFEFGNLISVAKHDEEKQKMLVVVHELLCRVTSGKAVRVSTLFDDVAWETKEKILSDEHWELKRLVVCCYPSDSDNSTVVKRRFTGAQNSARDQFHMTNPYSLFVNECFRRTFAVQGQPNKLGVALTWRLSLFPLLLNALKLRRIDAAPCKLRLALVDNFLRRCGKYVSIKNNFEGEDDRFLMEQAFKVFVHGAGYLEPFLPDDVIFRLLGRDKRYVDDEEYQLELHSIVLLNQILDKLERDSQQPIEVSQTKFDIAILQRFPPCRVAPRQLHSCKLKNSKLRESAVSVWRLAQLMHLDLAKTMTIITGHGFRDTHPVDYFK